jgi:calcineurin-like phosphoesterase family protein
MRGGNTWVIADPHFGHQGVCNFTRNDNGQPLRPWNDKDEMTRDLIGNWNAVVQDGDRVYLMGDVAMTKKPLLEVMPQLKGRIVLIKGNHDMEKMSVYAPFVDDIRACVVKQSFIMTHIPIHPQSMGRWKLNIHGHLHSDVVTKEIREPWGEWMTIPDERYVCVSVEQIDYRPKLLSHVLTENGL